jgi:hypothetical protein
MSRSDSQPDGRSECGKCHRRFGEFLCWGVKFVGGWNDKSRRVWEMSKCSRRKARKNVLLKATRQSSRLRGHGGILVEELAVRRKKQNNLDGLGNTSKLSFTILNNVDDESLIKTVGELGIHLANDEAGWKAQISAIKAEEMLRANLAEATYQAYLESLRHKECNRDDDILNLSIINNESRELPSSMVSQDKEAGDD